MSIITEEMRFRQILCEYALKHGVTKAARRYHTNRQFVYRQLKKYDGNVRSLALRSRRPKTSPKAHKKEELELIERMYKEIGVYGLAEVYVRCKSKGYERSFGNMCRQIRKYGFKKPKIKRQSYTRYIGLDGKYPGEKVQIDIKYVPESCIRFPTYGNKYYQITAIDEYSRKRILKIVKEKSTYETSKFLKTLETEMGFKIKTIQVDNGYEFVNDIDKTNKISKFQKVAEKLGIDIKRTRPYSPWQNGKVERSHREDEKIIYARAVFTSEKQLKRAIKKHETQYNSTAKYVLKFKSPNEIIKEYNLQKAS
ncbi:DDE-type integrase/transposase/recombinase [Peptoniphilus sp. SGI.035]|uniref:DDE-type integrase/transposase/recombinase n=1 Tax=Peptoniphilus sp. SGI.035 TaxID=3420564 RepID=UPI003CFD3957